MEQAGLPPDRAWGLLKLPTVPTARLQAVQKAVASGSSPVLAAQNAGLFTTLEGSVVRAALAAGSPVLAYQRMAETCALRAQAEGAIRSRMLLPVATLVLALFIQPLPQLVQGSLSAGGYLLGALQSLLALAVVVLLAKHLLVRAKHERWLLHLPLLGPAMARRNARTFFESLAWLLEAGVAMFEALPMAVATIEHTAMRQAYAGIKPRMLRGAALSEALTLEITEPLFLGDPQVTDFIATGEASGTLPEMLLRHTAMETQRLNQFDQQVAQWLPRLVYTAVALWMAYGMLTGAGFGPSVPAEL